MDKSRSVCLSVAHGEVDVAIIGGHVPEDMKDVLQACQPLALPTSLTAAAPLHVTHCHMQSQALDNCLCSCLPVALRKQQALMQLATSPSRTMHQWPCKSIHLVAKLISMACTGLCCGM